MPTTKSAQSGSAGGIVFLAVVFGLIWWQWDRIEGLFNIGGGQAAEVYGFNCTSGSSGTLMEGRVRNVGAEPLAVKVQVSITDTSNRPLETREIALRPTPIPPQQQGEFRSDAPPRIPDGGSCRFSAVVNVEGYPVKWKKKW